MWGVLGARGAVIVSVFLAVLLAGLPAPAAPGAGIADPEGPSLEDDMLPPVHAPRGAATEPVAAAQLPPTPGWTPYTSNYRFKARPTYKVRLVKRRGYDAGDMRAEWEAAVLRNPFVDMTVMPGTVRRTKPRKGEVLVMLSRRSACARSRPDWLGCSQPHKLTWVPGTRRTQARVHSGIVRIRPRLLTTYRSYAVNVAMHELGHILGMAHFNRNYNGVRQVMHSDPATLAAYQEGDRNGLASARRLEKGYRNFRNRAVTAVEVNGKPWLFGADATGNLWVRRPKKGGGFRWQDLDGVIQGAPGVVVGAGRVDVFAIGTNGDLHQKTWINGAWTAWANRLALSWIGGVDAMETGPGRFHVWGRASNRQLGHAYLDANNQWVANSALGGTLIGDVAVLHLPHIPAWSVWGVGTNQMLYQKNYTNGAWGSWTQVHDPDPITPTPTDFEGPLSVDRDSAGRYHVFGVTTSGDVRETVWTPGVGWKFRKRNTMPVRGRIGLLRNASTDRYRIFAPDLSGHLRTSVEGANGWSSFTVVGPR